MKVNVPRKPEISLSCVHKLSVKRGNLVTTIISDNLQQSVGKSCGLIVKTRDFLFVPEVGGSSRPPKYAGKRT
jgi:hypothetical protein